MAIKVLLFSFVIIFSFFSGCATTSKLQTLDRLQAMPPILEMQAGQEPPAVDQYLETHLQTNPDDSTMRWWTRFHQGRLWTATQPELSCRRFLEAGAEPKFPLHHVATLRALEVCKPDTPGLPSIDELLAAYTEPWLRDLVVHTAWKRSQQLGDRNWEMKLSAEKASNVSLASEKTTLLKRAIELALELQQTDLQAEYEARLWEVAPRLKPNPTASDWLRIAADFRRERKFDEARTFYRKVIDDPTRSDTERQSAYEGIRIAYKLQKQREAYVKATRDLAEFTTRLYKNKRTSRAWIARYHDTNLLYARTLWTEATVAEAVKVLKSLEKTLNRKYPLGEVHWVMGRIREEAGDFSGAVKLFERAANESRGNRNLRTKILWYHAWNLRKLKRYPEAVLTFRTLINEDTSPFDLAKYRYWLARSLVDQKQTELAASEYQLLIDSDPLGYYGLLAYRALNREIPPAQPLRQPAESEKPLALRAFRSLDEASYMEWLLSVGENEIARGFLNHTVQEYRKTTEPDEDAWRAILQYYARAGQYLTLFSRLGEFTPETRNRILQRDPSLLFPQPYLHHVSQASETFNVSRELIYSIMRQESAFNPEARSHADAFGLMQLIPEMANQALKTTGGKLQTPEDLYEPELNVRLGAAYLRELMDKYKDQFILTVASYNASERAIRGWLRTRLAEDPLEFIEDIPYDETKGYVKLVMRNLIFYMRLNSNGQSIPFPEHCLQNLHDFKL